MSDVCVPHCSVAGKSFNWEGILAGVFMAIMITRLFVLSERVARLDQQMVPISDSLADLLTNNTLPKQTFFLAMDRELNEFESMYVL